MIDKRIQIKELTDKWVENAVKGGGVSIGGNTECYRLLNNNIQLHDLNFDEFVSANINITRTLLSSGLNTIIVNDHKALWAWSAEVIMDIEFDLFNHKEYEIRDLFDSCIWASLSNPHRKEPHPIKWCEMCNTYDKIPHHSKYFLNQSTLSLSYLVFPLLEALCKKYNSEYIDINGKIKKDFIIEVEDKKTIEYTINRRQRKDRKGKTKTQCSSLKDLLFLLYKNANKELKKSLTEFREHLLTLDNKQDPFKLIYNWRNSSLHGSCSYQTIGGTLLNLSFLICLHKIGTKYNDKRQDILNRVIQNSQARIRPDFSYYPPS